MVGDAPSTSNESAQAAAVQPAPVSDAVLSRLRDQLESSSATATGNGGQHRGGVRKEKEVANSLEVVTDAIAKLEMLAAEETSST
jgi:hypothetical protein